MSNAYRAPLNASNIHTGALAIAAKISDQTMADLLIIDDAVKTGKISALVIKADIESDLTKEEIDGLPIPGSTVDGDKGTPFSPNNPDKYMYWDAGTKKEASGSFYNDLIACTGKGKANRDQVEAISKAMSGKDGYDRKLKAIGDDGLKALKADLDTQFSAFKNTFMRAVRVILQERAFTEHLAGKIVFAVQADGDGNYLSKSKPYRVGEAKALGVSDIFSVTSFLSFDPEECAKNGGTFEELLKTAARGKKETVSFGVTDYNTAEVAMSSFASWIEAQTSDEKLEKALYKYMSNPANASFVSSMFKVAEFLDDITVKPDLQKIAHKHAA